MPYTPFQRNRPEPRPSPRLLRHPCNTGLTGAQHTGTAGLLKSLLADGYMLSTKTRNYPWNVAGPHFNTLRKFFEAPYEALDGKAGLDAEKLVA
jgi:starvation-inducible DNA-binding protein